MLKIDSSRRIGPQFQEGWNPKGTGERSEAVILAKLLLRGDIVLQPFGDNQRYDLVVERNGAFIRIQCKTARIKNGRVEIPTSSRAGGIKARKGYSGEVDAFAAFCPCNGKCYWLTMDFVGNRKHVCLRIEPCHLKSLSYARDFEI